MFLASAQARADLFTTTDNLDAGDHSLAEAARELGAGLENVRTAPGFRRRLISRASEAVIHEAGLELGGHVTTGNVRALVNRIAAGEAR